jgi:hypothetical protein
LVLQIVRKARLVKEVEPIFSGDDAMKLAPETEGALSAFTGCRVRHVRV